jgi:hypothetical protein
MIRRVVFSAAIVCLLLPVTAQAQSRTRQGNARSGGGENPQSTSNSSHRSQEGPRTAVTAVRLTPGPVHLDRSPLRGTTMGGPITQPVDLPQRLPLLRPYPLAYYPTVDEPLALFGTPEPPSSELPGRTIFATTLGTCIDDPAHAGFSFYSRSVVSCEDSTVDVYLSYGDSASYAFLVPHDTDIKDGGYQLSVLDLVRFKPIGWSPDHMVPIDVGHVYIVWTNTDDFYLVRVNSIAKNHAAIEWVRHSRLSRREVQRHAQPEEPPQPDRGPLFPR